MKLNRWLNAMNHAFSKRRNLSRTRSARFAQQRRPRQVVESLEDRVMLTTYLVDSLDDAPVTTPNPNDGFTLREAIVSANQSSGVANGDLQNILSFSATIRFAPELFQSGERTLQLNAGAGAIDIVSNVMIEGPGADVLTIDGSNSGRIFDISVLFGTEAMISGIEFTGATDSAIFNESDLTLTKTRFINNKGTSGAAIQQLGSKLVIDQSEFVNNQATDFGGALFIDNRTIEAAKITDSTFTQNSASFGGVIASLGSDLTLLQTTFSDNSADNDGGAIAASVNGSTQRQSTTHIIGSVFEDNLAGLDGGAIDNRGSVLIVQESIIANNTATADGGAISSDDFTGNFTREADVTVLNSTISGNTATFGGGINIEGADIVVEQSTLTGNLGFDSGGGIAIRAEQSGNSNASNAIVVNSTLTGNAAPTGGGVYLDEGTLRLTHVTVTGNQSGTGGGLALRQNNSATTRVDNSIIAGNVDGSDEPHDIAMLTGSRFDTGNSHDNLIGDPNSAGGLADGVDGNIVGNNGEAWDIEDILVTTPMNLFGGTTATHALVADSPAIDTGNVAYSLDADGQPLTSDQRGFPFRRADSELGDSGRTINPVDIGAYEKQAAAVLSTSTQIRVSTSVDESDGNFTAGDLSLREAIEIANSNSDFTAITFDGLLAGTIELNPQLGELTIEWDTLIDGLGADQFDISGADGTRIFKINPMAEVTISDVTLRNGLATDFGGAIYNAGSTTLKNVVLSDNRRTNSGNLNTGGGGAIYNVGHMSITDSELFNNTSDVFGGAIYDEFMLHIGPGVDIHNNHALQGGGIYASEGLTGLLTIEESTIRSNTADNAGGILTTPSSRVEIRRSEIRGNLSERGGGGGILSQGSLYLADSVVDGNIASHPNGAAGGGIFVDTRGVFGSTVEIVRSTVSNNVASGGPGGTGGGLFLWPENAGTITVSNSTISHNSAVGGTVNGSSFGGGVVVWYGLGDAPSLIDNTIAFNFTLGKGGGLYAAGHTDMRSTLLSNNTQYTLLAIPNQPSIPVPQANDLYLPIARDANGNDIGKAADPTTSQFILNNVNTENIIDAYEFEGVPASFGDSFFVALYSRLLIGPTDPGLPNALSTDGELDPELADNGGIGFTHRLQAASPAIDRARTTSAGVIDQRGFVQTVNDSESFPNDVGSYEIGFIERLPFTVEVDDAGQFGQDNPVMGLGFDDGNPNSSIPKKPGFLGFEFDPDPFYVGTGIGEGLLGDQYGGEAIIDLDGRVGFEYGYYLNSGSLDTFYQGLFSYSIDDSMSGNGQFTIDTGVNFTDGGLFTVSPRLGAYLDLVLEFNASIDGKACFIDCAEGTIPINIDESVPLFSINRQVEDDKGNPLYSGGAPLLDGEVKFGGGSIQDFLAGPNQDGENFAEDLWDLREQLQDIINDEREEKAKRQSTDNPQRNQQKQTLSDKIREDTKKKVASEPLCGGEFVTVCFGEAEGDLLGLEAEVKAGFAYGDFSIGKPLGSIAVTVPDVQLSDTTLNNSAGRLSATTDDFMPGSEEDLKRQIAKISVDVGAIGPLGKYELSAGPIDIEATTVSYIIAPRLNVTQDVAVEPFFDASHQAAFEFNGFSGTIGVIVGSGSEVSVSSGTSIAFMPGQKIVIKPRNVNPASISITPSLHVGQRFSNDVGLDIDVKAMLEILRLKLSAFGEELIDTGALISDTHTLVEPIGLGSIFNKTFELPTQSTTLDAFPLVDAELLAARTDGRTPGTATSLSDGIPVASFIQPNTQQQIWYTLPLTDATGVTHPDVLFSLQSGPITATQVTVPYAGLTLEILDENGTILAGVPVDGTINLSTLNVQNPRFLRFKDFDAKLNPNALFGVTFLNPIPTTPFPVTHTATLEGGDPPLANGEDTASLITPAKLRAANLSLNSLAVDNDRAFDIDDDGFVSVATDGVLIHRYMQEASGSALIAGAVSASAQRTSSSAITGYLDELAAEGRLDADNSNNLNANVDGVLILRHISGITGDQLVDGLSLAGNRTNPAAISVFLSGSTFTVDIVNTADAARFRNRANGGTVISTDAVVGSSPWLPHSGTNGGTLSIDNFGRFAQYRDLYLLDENDPTLRTLVQTGATGTPSRSISDASQELRDLAKNPTAQNIDGLANRLQAETRSEILGVDEPIFVRVSAETGYEFEVPSGFSVTTLVFDPAVGGNSYLNHTVEKQGSDIDFDLFLLDSNQSFEISMGTPFNLPAGVRRFRLTPRGVTDAKIFESLNNSRPELQMTIGLVIDGPETDGLTLTLNAVGQSAAPPTNSTTAASLTFADPSAPTQYVSAVPTSDTVGFGGTVNVDLNYRTDTQSSPAPHTVQVELHYNSDILEFAGLGNLVQNGLIGFEDKAEDIADNDAGTDRMVVLSWSTSLGSWPADAATAQRLASVQFTAVAAAGNATVRLTGQASNGYQLVTSTETLTATSTQFIVTNLTDESDGNFTFGNFSIREAVEQANANGGPAEIRFDPVVHEGTIVLDGAQLVISNDINIIGPGADTLTIDATGNSRIFAINSGIEATIVGLTLTKGNAGAIENLGTLTIDSSRITGNSTDSTGGGIFNTGTLSIQETELSDNASAQAGGAVWNNSNLTIVNSTLSGNQANFDGGAITTVAGNVTIRNSTITGNRSNADGMSAGPGGGVFQFDSAVVTLHNTIIAGNLRGAQGSGVPDDVFPIVDAASSHNLIGQPTGFTGITHGNNGNILGDGFGGRLPIDQILDSTLTDNGGPTRTHALSQNGSAIDAGSNTQAIDANGEFLPTDQRDRVRIFGGTVDIGAYEYSPAPGFRITESNGSTSVTAGETPDVFSIVLDSPPARQVELLIASDRTDIVDVRFRSVIFSPNNWNVPQEVEVYGVEDFMEGGTETANITISVRSQQPDDVFTNVSPQSITVTVGDSGNTGGSELAAIDQELGFTQESAQFFNSYGAGEKWLRAANRNWYFLLPNGDLIRWDGTNGSATGTLRANVGTDVYNNPALLYDAYQVTVETDPAVIDEQLGFTGESTQFFDTYGAGERWLRAANRDWYFLLPDGSLVKWNGTSGSASGITVARFSVDVYNSPALLFDAYQIDLGTDLAAIDEQLGFTGESTSSFNYGKQNDKWLQAENGDWYILLPNGNLIHWDGTRSSASGTTVAMLGTNVYTNPSLLYDAFQVELDPNLAAELVTLDELHGFYKDSRGFYFNSRGMQEKWIRSENGDWWIIKPNGQLLVWNGGDSFTLVDDIAIQAYTDPSLLYDAFQPLAETDPEVVDERYGFTSEATEFFNSYGAQEKWMRAANGSWFFLLPGGDLVQWDGIRGNATGATVAELGTAVYNDPALLFNAATVVVKPGRATLTAPTGTVAARPEFRWNTVSGATVYDLWVDNLTTGEEQVIREQNLTSTSFTPSADLPDGSYQVWVRAGNSAGFGAWSLPDAFLVRREFDTIQPTADIVDVAPDPRTGNAGVVTINFSEGVTGVDIFDFSLIVDDGLGAIPIDVSGTTVTQITASQYTIDLIDETSVSGMYRLALNFFNSNAGIRDFAGNALIGEATDSWTVELPPPPADIVNPVPDSHNENPGLVTIDLFEDVTEVDNPGFAPSLESSSRLNHIGRSEKWFQDTTGNWYFLLPERMLALWRRGRNQATGITAELGTDVSNSPWLLDGLSIASTPLEASLLDAAFAEIGSALGA